MWYNKCDFGYLHGCIIKSIIGGEVFLKKITGASNAMEELLSKSNETQIKDLGEEKTPEPISKTISAKNGPRPQTRRTENSPRINAAVNRTSPKDAPRPIRKKKKKKMSLFAAVIAELKDLLKNVKIPKKAIVTASTCVLAVTVLVAAIFVLSKLDFSKETVPDIYYNSSPITVSAEANAIPMFSNIDVSDRHTVTVDIFEGDTLVCSTLPTTVSDIIDIMNVSVSDDYVLRGSPEDTITEDVSINYDKITYGTVTETASVPYETKTFEVQNVARGKSVVTKTGVNGVSTATYKVTYVNGVESERVLQSQVITKQPITQVIHKGVGGTITIGGKTYSYSHYIDCKTTVYTGGGITASGLPATEKVIAVDPRVIPLGTQVYVEDPYCYVGFRTAADTGGVIKGNFIDIYFDESNPSLWGYGVRSARVYILD